MDESFRQLAEAGYQVRPARFEDLPQLVPMFNAAEAELNGAGDWTVERYRKEWQESGIDLEASTRVVVAPDGSMVGCVELWDHFNPPVGPWIWGRVHPQWKGRAIGSALLAWALATSKRASIGSLRTCALPLTSPHRPTIDLASSSSKARE